MWEKNVIFMSNEKLFLGILSKVINFSLVSILKHYLTSFLEYQNATFYWILDFFVVSSLRVFHRYVFLILSYLHKKIMTSCHSEISNIKMFLGRCYFKLMKCIHWQCRLWQCILWYYTIVIWKKFSKAFYSDLGLCFPPFYFTKLLALK